MLDTLTGGPATAGELAALLPIVRPGYPGTYGCCGRRGWPTCARRRGGGSTVSALSPSPGLMNGRAGTGPCGEQRLDALHAEVTPGKRERRSIT